MDKLAERYNIKFLEDAEILGQTLTTENNITETNNDRITKAKTTWNMVKEESLITILWIPN